MLPFVAQFSLQFSMKNNCRQPIQRETFQVVPSQLIQLFCHHRSHNNTNSRFHLIHFKMTKENPKLLEILKDLCIRNISKMILPLCPIS